MSIGLLVENNGRYILVDHPCGKEYASGCLAAMKAAGMFLFEGYRFANLTEQEDYNFFSFWNKLHPKTETSSSLDCCC